MIALDISALVAIAEPEEDDFVKAIARHEALLGTPVLLETRMVLATKMPDYADTFISDLLKRPSIHPVAFSLDMYRAALNAFRRFGKGQQNPAGLNFGDCMSYAVAKVHGAPLLYKGDDFRYTDIAAVFP
ncbi:MAG TPA: type II toxin-antitoxin system VapC family toxin [Beijerinckiaceae bacterium]|jgi:ribonuclease VapC